MLFRLLASVVIVAAFVPRAAASTNVDIGEYTYEILARLEAEGVIQSCLLTTRPISRGEAARLLAEAERNAEDAGPLARRLVGRLKESLDGEGEGVNYVKPFEKAYAEYIYSDRAGQELNYNNDGDDYGEGINLRAGLASRADLGRVSFYFNPELRYSEDDEDFVVKRAYSVLSFWGLELEAGKDSQWWGPGRHGALLLSNNAEPLTMLKLTNPHPVLLPWVFERLGPFRFVFFVSRLEEERAVAEPYIWGLRLNFKPSPYVELGLARTAMLGGEGRSESLGTWWRSFTGRGENDPGIQAGDQRAGFDIKITLPFEWQPMQIYAEAAGEDEAGGLPSKWAYLGGVYLPGIFDDRLALRAEYANNHIDGSPNVWYVHSVYRTGYRFKGRVLGHHMGTDSEDIFLELSYLLPELRGAVRISYDRERHNLSGAVKPTKDEVRADVRYDFESGIVLEGAFAFGRLEDSAGGDEEAGLLTLTLDYAF